MLSTLAFLAAFISSTFCPLTFFCVFPQMTHFCWYSNSGAKRCLEDLLVLGSFTSWLGKSLYRSLQHNRCHLGLFCKNLSTSFNSVARSAEWSLHSCDAHFPRIATFFTLQRECSWLIIWIFYLVSAQMAATAYFVGYSKTNRNTFATCSPASINYSRLNIDKSISNHRCSIWQAFSLELEVPILNLIDQCNMPFYQSL